MPVRHGTTRRSSVRIANATASKRRPPGSTRCSKRRRTCAFDEDWRSPPAFRAGRRTARPRDSGRRQCPAATGSEVGHRTHPTTIHAGVATRPPQRWRPRPFDRPRVREEPEALPAGILFVSQIRHAPAAPPRPPAESPDREDGIEMQQQLLKAHEVPGGLGRIGTHPGVGRLSQRRVGRAMARTSTKAISSQRHRDLAHQEVREEEHVLGAAPARTHRNASGRQRRRRPCGRARNAAPSGPR